MSHVLTTPHPYEIASDLKTLCDDAHAAMEIVAERIDDHFLQAELIHFGHQFRQISVDLRKVLLRLDAPAEYCGEKRAEARQWDTALTNRERYAMLQHVEGLVREMYESLRAALADYLPQGMDEIVDAHYLEVKQILRQLRVMREMVNPY